MRSSKSDRVFVKWGNRRNRSDQLADLVGARLVTLRWANAHPAVVPIRYLVQSIHTLLLLLWLRPQVVFSQHTQPFCSAMAVIYGKLTGAIVIADCHNAPFTDRRWRSFPMRLINDWVLARTWLNLVHNDGILDFVERDLRLPGRFETFIGPVPDLSVPEDAVVDHGFVLAVCSFADDEPIAEMFRAFESLASVRVRVTGNPERLPAYVRSAVPSNVELTGFVDDAVYDRLVREARVVIALSTRDNIIMQACQEAIGAERPLVTSDGRVAREFLRGGTVFVTNDAVAIAAGIRRALDDHDGLRDEMARLRRQREHEWQTELEQLVDRLAEARSGPPARRSAGE